MTPFRLDSFHDGLIVALITISCQIAVVVLFAWLISRFTRSASFRSSVWLAALAAAVLLPALSLTFSFMRWKKLNLPVVVWATDGIPLPAQLPDSLPADQAPSADSGVATVLPVTVDRAEAPTRNRSNRNAPTPLVQTPLVSARDATTPIKPDRMIATDADESVMPSAPAVRSFLLSIWIIGMGFLTLRFAWGCIQLHRMRSRAVPIDSESARRALDRARKNLDLKRPVRLMSSTQVSGPVATDGLRGAMILLPPSVLSMSGDRIADVLTHEVAHILHRDVMLGIAQRIVRIVYWPHPLIHLLTRELSRSREEICDNHVLLHGSVGDYAHTLVELATETVPTRSAVPACGIFDSANGLQQRIESLLDERRNLMTQQRRFCFLTFALLFCGASVIGVRSMPVQAGDPPINAEASIRGADDADGQPASQEGEQAEEDAEAQPAQEKAMPPIRSRPIFGFALPAKILDVTVSADEERVAIIDDRAIATIQMANTGRTLLSFSVLSREDQDKLGIRQDSFFHSASLCFSPDGKTLAVACGPVIRLHDSETGRMRRSLLDARLLDEWNSLGRNDPVEVEKLETIPHAHGHTYSIAFSPDGSLLASSGTHLIWPGGRSVINAELPTHGKLKIWDPDHGELLHDLGKHYETVRAIAFAGDSLAAVGSWPEGWNMGVEIWDPSKGKRVQTHAIGRGGGGDAVALSADGKWAAALAAYSDPDPDQPVERLTRFQHLHLWNRDSGELAHRMKMDRYVDSIAFSPDGTTLAMGISGHGVEFWDTKTLKRRGTAEFGRKNVSDVRVAFCPSGKRLAATANIKDEGFLMLWKLDR